MNAPKDFKLQRHKIMDPILTVVEYIGIISFSISGTIAGIQKKNDMLGIIFCALLTALGGGMIRDITLGIIPNLLTNPDYAKLALICIAVALVFGSLAFNGRFYNFLFHHKNNFWLFFTDAIGISVFCVFGIDTALKITAEKGIDSPSAILLVFCGCVSAVGGGLLRDIFSAEIPFIFRKYFYLTPVIFGALLYVHTYDRIPNAYAKLSCIAIVIIIRILAIIFKWNLPVPRGKTESAE